MVEHRYGSWYVFEIFKRSLAFFSPNKIAFLFVKLDQRFASSEYRGINLRSHSGFPKNILTSRDELGLGVRQLYQFW